MRTDRSSRGRRRWAPRAARTRIIGWVRRTDGAGLGLSIVGAIAAAHGGRGALGSVPGRGATFTLVLPARPAPLAEDSVSSTVDEPLATADEPVHALPETIPGGRP